VRHLLWHRMPGVHGWLLRCVLRASPLTGNDPLVLAQRGPPLDRAVGARCMVITSCHHVLHDGHPATSWADCRPAGADRYRPAARLGANLTPMVTPIAGVAGEAIRVDAARRQNLTIRMSMRRFARLTNGFSKRVANAKLFQKFAEHPTECPGARVRDALHVLFCCRVTPGWPPASPIARVGDRRADHAHAEVGSGA
jgi:hypothetical protein